MEAAAAGACPVAARSVRWDMSPSLLTGSTPPCWRPNLSDENLERSLAPGSGVATAFGHHIGGCETESRFTFSESTHRMSTTCPISTRGDMLLLRNVLVSSQSL